MGFFSKKQEDKPIISKNSVGYYVDAKTKSSKLIKAQKGEVLRKEIKFPKELGEMHPFDAALTEAQVLKIGFVGGAVDKYVDFIMGPGFYVKSDNPKAEKIINDWTRDVDFEQLLRVWLKEALHKPHGIMELGGKVSEVPKGVKVLDGKYVWVKRDSKGKIEKFNQFFGKIDMFNKSKLTDFRPHEIAQLCFNKTGDMAYGMGIVAPNLLHIDSLLENETSMRVLMRRKANAPIHAKLGTMDEPVTEDAVNSFGADLEYMIDKTEFATDHTVEFKVVDFGRIADKFEFPIEHDMDMLFAGFQIPQVLMGAGSIPEGLAKVQLEAFDRNIKSKQAEAEKVIEQKIFKRVLLANGIDAHVEFEWGRPSQSETENRITKIQLLLGMQTLSDTMRHFLELELARLMDFDVDAIEKLLEEEKIKKEEEAQEIKDQFNKEREDEENTEQPLVPGQNNPKASLHVHEKLEDDYTLKEWLGFNYKDFLSSILSINEKDDYEMIKASTQAELDAGKFGDVQVEELRQVMGDGFAEEKTIKQISKDISENVTINDLYQTEDGDFKKNAAGERILAYNATSRPIIIARSETTRLAALGAQHSYNSGGIKQYRWVASKSDRTCPSCEELHGTVHKINNGVLPPKHTLCRCTIVPVVDLE